MIQDAKAGERIELKNARGDVIVSVYVREVRAGKVLLDFSEEVETLVKHKRKRNNTRGK